MPTTLRNFIPAILLILGISMQVSAQIKGGSSDTQARPNIIYIMSDDLTTQAISIYGGIYKDIAPTPNMDRIAKEGMLFHNVMCTNAICGPSRAAILTGNYSHVNGYYKNEEGGQFDNRQWTFPQEFQKNGYKTALFGKWHLGSDPVGFDEY
ncbi:MAG TPA: sulfatase-like hydrolase/transferase, partial [Saprospiraceae bacterium]|nr:sulfatase-like hydrolase/transferase [Saprospiraceae bacterium]